MHDADEIERAIAAFARAPNGGLIANAETGCSYHIVTDHHAGGPRTDCRRSTPLRYYVAAGGLISYGPTTSTSTGRSGRLRRPHPQGREAADLPVQAPIKYELVINLKTAKALGLDVPAQLLARADEVIE